MSFIRSPLLASLVLHVGDYGLAHGADGEVPDVGLNEGEFMDMEEGNNARIVNLKLLRLQVKLKAKVDPVDRTGY